MNEATTTRNNRSGWRNPWVIGWIALIVVVLGVNLTMVVLAIATNPGLVVDDYYERGRAMERTITSRVAETPDWTMSIDTPADAKAGEPTTVRFFVVDRAGQPVDAEQVTYFAYRPSDASRDFSRPMVEEVPGRYAVELTFPIGGLWDTVVEVKAADVQHALDQRITVAQP